MRAKVGTSSPKLGAVALLMLACLANTAAASNTQALRGQLHKSTNSNKPIRRRRVHALSTPLKETTLKEAPLLPLVLPLKDLREDTSTKSPSSMKTKAPTGVKTKVPSVDLLKEDKDLREGTTKSPISMKTKAPTLTKRKAGLMSLELLTEDQDIKVEKTKTKQSLSYSTNALIDEERKKTKTKQSLSYSTNTLLDEERKKTKSTMSNDGSSILSMLINEENEANTKKKRKNQSYSYSMGMSAPTKRKKKEKGSASSLSLGYLLVKRREIPTTNLQKCLKPKVAKDAIVKKPEVKEAVKKPEVTETVAKQPAPELKPTKLDKGEEVKVDIGGVRRRQQEEVEDAASTTGDISDGTGDTVDAVDITEEADEIISNHVQDVEDFEQFADFDIICDADGNLLEGETWAPTMAPYEDDEDGDGLSDEDENNFGTDPQNQDSDQDGLSDLQEVFIGTDPLNADSDGDGYTDGEEVEASSNPLDSDTTPDINDEEDDSGSQNDEDGDGLSDEDETNIFGTDPLIRDSDKDGISDYDEVQIHGTDPNKADTDGDGIGDATEVKLGFDPLAPASNEDVTPSPGCNSFAREQVYKTRIPARVQFEYEVAIDSAADVNSINTAMENKIARLVGRELINCESTRRLEGEGRQHRHLLVDGVDPAPVDIVTSKTCRFFTASNEATPDNSKCYTIRSFMTLYLREDSVQTSKLQSSSKALKAILTAFNLDSPSPFLAGQGGEFSVDGLKGVHYMHGEPDDGVKYEYGGGPSSSTTSDSKSSFLQPLIISLICVGAVLLVIAAVFFVATREKGQVTEEIYAEFADDALDQKHHGEEQSTDEEADSLSNNSPPPQMVFRAAHGEDDSVFAGLDDVLPGDDKHHSSPARSLASSIGNGFEYVPSGQAEQPNYENPASLDSNGRPYRAEDTIVL